MLCKACNYDPDELYTQVCTFIIKESWPSQNELSSNLKGRSGFKYRRWRDKFEKATRPAEEPAQGQRRVWFTRHYGARKRDFDYANLVGGGKPLIDTLVRCGYFVDDSPKLMIAYYKQEKSKTKEDYITVVIEEKNVILT